MKTIMILVPLLHIFAFYTGLVIAKIDGGGLWRRLSVLIAGPLGEIILFCTINALARLAHVDHLSQTPPAVAMAIGLVVNGVLTAVASRHLLACSWRQSRIIGLAVAISQLLASALTLYMIHSSTADFDGGL